MKNNGVDNIEFKITIKTRLDTLCITVTLKYI